MVASTITDVINADTADHSPSPAIGCSSSVPCSICLDLVIDDGERSIAKLHCGHKFHLDCIGSAFNTKGAMQCPNCRKVESGRWLFADGSAHESSEAGARDRMAYEGLRDLSNFRRIGSHWRPFGGFAVHSLIEETVSSLNRFADFLGNYATITEHTGGPSSAPSYISYFQPIGHAGNSNFHHPLNSHPAPRNNIHSTHIQHPRWGNGNLTLTATRRSTHARTQPVYYTQQPVSMTRESSAANSWSRERNEIHHTTYRYEQPGEATNMPSSTNGFRRSGGALTLPMILPAVHRQTYNHGVHGLYISETERDESSYVPMARRSFHHR